MTSLKSLKGFHVAMTGTCSRPRAELVRLIKRKGGRTTDKARVPDEPTILVRGHSKTWLFGDHGIKELRLALNIQDGIPSHLVYADAFEDFLTRGTPMPVAEVIAGEDVDSLEAEAWSSDGRDFSDILPSKPERTDVRAGDRATIARQRTEQARLRSLLLLGEQEGQCMLCGLMLPASLLVAAHIKPRAHCTRKEQSDFPAVVMLACQMGCDALYERGYITVNEKGAIKVASSPARALNRELKARFSKRSFLGSLEERDRYFDWHRKYRFQGQS